MSLRRILAAEFIGTLLLLAVIVGSGIMGERLASGNAALALLGNSLATGCGLWVLIVIFEPVSGAHFNPLVSAMAAVQRKFGVAELLGRCSVQCLGAVAGVWLAHAMFDLPLLQYSRHLRSGPGQWLGEFVATFGLMLTIIGASCTRPQWAPLLVAVYIVGAYWFTASTAFANPAVMLARSLTESFAGIAPSSLPGFIVSQAVGAVAGVLFGRWLWAQDGSITSIETT